MKILVVVDMQNDFITGVLGNDETKAVVPAVCNKIKKAIQDRDTKIFCTLDTHTEDYLNTMEGKKLPIPHCIRGTEGWKLSPDIKDALGGSATIVEKPTFGSESLPVVIHEEVSEVTEIAVCGVCTDICVISNVLLLKAAFHEVPITVDSSCCAGVTPETHKNALDAMKMCHIEVV